MGAGAGLRLATRGLALLLGGTGSVIAGEARLHGPSPDWRDQIIYFTMIDRFDDGDPRNNDQGQGEFNPADPARYSGGDLRGMLRRLDYVQALGATALWITPPVAHRWWDAQAHYGGYHGYWGEHFKRVDRHFGGLRDYRKLSRELHRRDMYLVQDIVVNHMANWSGYDTDFDANDPARGFRLNPDADGRRAPSQSPFDQNDVRDPAQRAAAIYHWTPVIRDHASRAQQLHYQLADLDDLNTETPRVRQALRDSYGYWIREVGVDAFRVDTAFHVPPDYFEDFLHASDDGAPGIMAVARDTGREQFLVFGEGFGIDKPFDETQARRIDAYMRGADSSARMQGMLNFPLYGSTLDVLARGQPTAVLAHRISSVMQRHANPHLMPSFVDNHDVDRFLASGSEAALKQALLLIMTLPGIPTIYYGTEQGFVEQRGAMFARGFASGGRDRFDQASPLFKYVQRLTALRRGHRVLSRGIPEVLAQNAATPGVLAYRMVAGKEVSIIVFNSAEHAALLGGVATGLPAGTVLEARFAIDGDAPELVVDARGQVSRELPARSGFVWQVTPRRVPVPEAAPLPVINAMGDTPVSGDLQLGGTARAQQLLEVIVDGALPPETRVTADDEGRWRATVDTASMIDADLSHQVIVCAEDAKGCSQSNAFRVTRSFVPLADLVDPADDDHGPGGQYQYPDDAVWRSARPLDIRRVRAAGSGGALQLDVQMRAISTHWNPAHGFDHVAFSIFIELPDQPGGSTWMPQQQASLPAGIRWHYRLRAHGWSNALFAADAASATHEGRIVSPAARIEVFADRQTVRFTLPAASLGGLKSLKGARIYLSTWDYDGGYRKLAPNPGPMVFGGGEADQPLIMDDTAVITL